jgi:hypothetical protein
MKKLFLLFTFAGTGIGVFAQGDPPADQSPCQVYAEPYADCRTGITYLNATPGFQTYQWSPATWVSNPNIANPTTTIPGSYTVTACTVIGSELVTNGDFSAGNTGFTSGQTYSTWYTPGNYYVGPDWFSPAYNPGTYPDHTGTADNMFMSVDGGPAGTLLWSQTIPVSAFTDYKFEFFHTMCNVNPPIFEIRFTGDVTGMSTVLTQTGALGSGVWQWDGIQVDCWNSQNNNTVTIEVINNEGNGYGNDFAMDDFSFRQCCCSKYVVNAPATMGQNLFANWDFSAGNTGFTSGLTYLPVYSPGNYWVGPGWFSSTYDPNFPDHTPTSDNMFMSIDGAATVLWEQTVSVIPFEVYNFSFWATRADYKEPKFEVHFIGNVTGDVIVLTQNGYTYAGAWQWDQYGVPCWNAGQNTSMTVRIVNLEPDGNGVDFGMDDFSIRQCCRRDDCCRHGGPNPNREAAPVNNSGFDVFPNPSNGAFTIQYPTAVENAQVEILNVLGERVDAFTFSGTVYNYTPSVKLAPGLYLVRITNNGVQKDTELIIE